MEFRKVTLDIRAIREEMGLSQSEFADLLSVSPRTVQSCEQGWRKPSSALEKSALLLFMAHRNGRTFGKKVCWEQPECNPKKRKDCMTYRSGQGHLCWLMSGTLCRGLRLNSWSDKLSFCLQCDFFFELLDGDLPILDDNE
jgi:DNA-binding XRE family transcriptional regulator